MSKDPFLANNKTKKKKKKKIKYEKKKYKAILSKWTNQSKKTKPKTYNELNIKTRKRRFSCKGPKTPMIIEIILQKINK